MKLLTQYSSRKSWIAIADDADESDLVRRIRSTDIILSDLDKTDAYPGREVALSFLTNGRNILDRKFWNWAGTAGYLLYLEGKQAYNNVVLSFANLFVKTPSELTRIRKKYQESYVLTTFYPAVLDFYSAFPKALKIYVTRNIKEIATAYAAGAHFNYAMPEQYDKKSAVDIIHQEFPDKKQYLVRGDTIEDQAMAQRLKEIKDDKSIDDVVYINVAFNKRNMNQIADINTSRNQTALAEWVKGKVY